MHGFSLFGDEWFVVDDSSYSLGRLIQSLYWRQIVDKILCVLWLQLQKNKINFNL